jgi:hypothetical protein
LAANRHLNITDTALLTSFVLATSRAQCSKGNVADFERCCRAQIALARSLRLTQRSVDAKTAGRRVRDSQALQSLIALNEECEAEIERPWEQEAS